MDNFTNVTKTSSKKHRLTHEEIKKRTEINLKRKKSNLITVQKRTRKKKKEMLDALVTELGIVTTAAKAIGISPRTHYRWLALDPDYKKSVEVDVPNTILDFVENSLFKSIKQGNVRAQTFYLNTKGQKRGYVPKTETFTEHSGEINNPSGINFILQPDPKHDAEKEKRDKLSALGDNKGTEEVPKPAMSNKEEVDNPSQNP